MLVLLYHLLLLSVKMLRNVFVSQTKHIRVVWRKTYWQTKPCDTKYLLSRIIFIPIIGRNCHLFTIHLEGAGRDDENGGIQHKTNIQFGRFVYRYESSWSLQAQKERGKFVKYELKNKSLKKLTNASFWLSNYKIVCSMLQIVRQVQCWRFFQRHILRFG